MNASAKSLSIDHVQLAINRDVSGMKEAPKPEVLAKRGGCWFVSEQAQVHLGVEEDFRPAKKSASRR